MTDVYVALGSNLERGANIHRALLALHAQYAPLRISSLYDAAAEGFAGPRFYNLAVHFRIQLDAQTLAAALRTLEFQLGRPATARKHSSRPIDIDLLLHGATQIDTPTLTLPRPDLYRCAYVLAPLAELAPELRPPGCTQTLRELWAEFDQSRVNQTRLPLPWPELSVVAG